MMNKMKKFYNLMNLEQSKMNLLFLMMMMLSTLITLNATSWISAWMGMEMNLMSFIPLMMMKNKLFNSSNAMMTYFMVQTSSSCLLLFMIMMNKMEMDFTKLNLLNMIIQLSLMMKMGAAPTHWWVPKIINMLSWKNCFIMLTWQKLAPISLITMTNSSTLIYKSIILSLIIGAILGINQTSIKLIISYSSINHISWLLISIMMNISLFYLYFIIYSLSILMICSLLNNMNINYLNQLYKNYNFNMFSKILLMMMFLSMAGIPPMIGFFPKLKILMMMIKNNLIMESLIFIFFSLITLSYYMYPLLSIMMLSKMNSKWMNNKMIYMKYIMFIILINIILSLIIIIIVSM
uniref:NADH dehydrogenase subunit 2 n=1 Tax=Odontocimbex svenhedini TaxID=2798527 RepID=UPI00223742CB|nr:NADH dehydrogenase subunit 2 [Odontocimbex svenhedini]UYK52157.1 NADH dehydrogenase subunit 2 [Odontocimbex svenhedini]